MMAVSGRFDLPAAGPGSPSQESPAPSPPVPGCTPRRVLVVDDEPDLADLAGTLLCACGLEVRVAYCGADALLMLESDPAIDAVFSDVMMPGMTGLQLAEAIGHLYPSCKVVLTTGFALPAMMANQGRPYPCAAKPYRIETVLALLRGERPSPD
jgi:two-component system OmpR family response regulator